MKRIEIPAKMSQVPERERNKYYQSNTRLGRIKEHGKTYEKEKTHKKVA